MKKMNLLKTFTEIPEILNYDFTPENAVAWVKDEFEKKLGFDFVLIGYLNADSIDIKAISEPDKRVLFNFNQYRRWLPCCSIH